MKKVFSLFILIMLIVACSQKQAPRERQEEAITIQQNEPGDSTLYGLACDGCTDSILILLPYAGGDPDTFDIINAHETHQIYGRPRIGDDLAVVLNPEDKNEALMIINLERLKGEWCYMVTPTLKRIDRMPPKMQRRMLERIPDSVKERLLQPREYGFRIKQGHTVQAIGNVRRDVSADNMSPVEYPRQRRYREWKLYNGLGHIDAGYDGSDGTAFTILKRQKDGSYVGFGKLWPEAHVDNCMIDVYNLWESYRCGTVYTEKNADKGYLAKNLNGLDIPAETYHEKQNKHLKISTILKKNWKKIHWIPETDPEYLLQITEYSGEQSPHDDAPDSAASLIRIFENKPTANTADYLKGGF